jgi:hypothetical protein
MNLHPQIRDSINAMLKQLRSKALDTEKRLLLDQLTPEQLLDKAETITGLGILMEHEARGAIIKSEIVEEQLTPNEAMKQRWKG